MNKTQLIDALAERLGDKKIAAAAVAGLVDVVIRTVNAGDKVTITGFGVFERHERAARTARNPRTGESVKVKKSNVPVFRAGTLFREVVSGARKLPRVGASTNGAATARPAAAAASRLTAGPSTNPTRATAAEHLTEVPAAAAKTKATTAVKAAKAAAKAAKVAKKESKNATKAPATAPSKGTGRKAVKKSATKK